MEVLEQEGQANARSVQLANDAYCEQLNASLCSASFHKDIRFKSCTLFDLRNSVSISLQTDLIFELKMAVESGRQFGSGAKLGLLHTSLTTGTGAVVV